MNADIIFPDGWEIHTNVPLGFENEIESLWVRNSYGYTYEYDTIRDRWLNEDLEEVIWHPGFLIFVAR